MTNAEAASLMKATRVFDFLQYDHEPITVVRHLIQHPLPLTIACPADGVAADERQLLD